MKRLILLSLCLTGCVRFHVEQTDTSPDERIIRTSITGTAWFSSAQSLQKLKVLQTDKTQSTGLDAANQQGATNTVAALEALARIAEAAAKIAP
jgi:hypothetical protein